MDKLIKEQTTPDCVEKDLTEKEKRLISQLPNSIPKADIDILHDVDKLAIIPQDDGSLTIISTKRKLINNANKK